MYCVGVFVGEAFTALELRHGKFLSHCSKEENPEERVTLRVHVFSYPRASADTMFIKGCCYYYV